MRLHVFLAKCGLASRRACEKIIQEGRVEVNGATVHQKVSFVTPSDTVTVDGKKIAQIPLRYYALNKPIRYICSNSDQYGRALAVNLIADSNRTHLFTVGRLDWLSSGLILITNDGHFSRTVTLPSSGIEKEYLVESLLDIPIDKLENFYTPQSVNGVRYCIKNIKILSPQEVQIVLIEGKNREIRTIMDTIHTPIVRLHRIRIGSIEIGDLKSGEYRPLEAQELNSLVHR